MRQLTLDKKKELQRLLRMVAVAIIGFSLIAKACPVAAQPSASPGAQAPVPVPGFWDPRRRPERPDMSRITQIRFLTEFDYPPFN